MKGYRAPSGPQYRKDRRAKLRKECIQIVADYLKEHPCIDCGERDIIVLQFDHVRGTKIADIGSICNMYNGKQLLHEEIVKCEVRCANCHIRVTAKRAGGWMRAL